MRPVMLIGYVMWRAGVLLAAGASFYFAFWWILSAYTIPAVVKIGLGLSATGFVALMASLILERVGASQREAVWRE